MKRLTRKIRIGLAVLLGMPYPHERCRIAKHNFLRKRPKKLRDTYVFIFPPFDRPNGLIRIENTKGRYLGDIDHSGEYVYIAPTVRSIKGKFKSK